MSLLDCTLDWEIKDQYLDLLEDLTSGKINSFQFYLEFRERNALNSEVFDSLRANFFILSPTEKSKGFAHFICEIMNLCYGYCEVVESYLPKEEVDFYDLEFRNSVENIYLKIKNFLNER